MYGEVLLESLVVNDVLKKEVGKDFLSKCQHNIESDTSSPELKYHTLCVTYPHNVDFQIPGFEKQKLP